MMAWMCLPCEHVYQSVFSRLPRTVSHPTHSSAAAHQGLLLLPQPLVIFRHLLLLLVQDLPHLGPLSLPELLGLFPAAGSDEVLLLGGQWGERGGRSEPSPQTQRRDGPLKSLVAATRVGLTKLFLNPQSHKQTVIIGSVSPKHMPVLQWNAKPGTRCLTCIVFKRLHDLLDNLIFKLLP